MRFTDKTYRRAWFLSRMRRARPGSGSDYSALMQLPRSEIAVPFADLFPTASYAVVGGVATRAYAPERSTKDIDVLIRTADVDAARSALGAAGATRTATLALAGSQLGLFGEVWELAPYGEIDLLWSGEPWAGEAVAGSIVDATGLRIVPLGYLVLMKLDASRGIDQGDLSRMLGLADAPALDDVRRVIAAYMPQALEDLESYITLGRLEVGRDNA